MAVKYLKKVTEITAKMHPQHVHLVCQGTLSVSIIVSFILHTMSPLAEATGLTVSALFAAWQRDFELRMIKNLKRIAHDFEEELEEE